MTIATEWVVSRTLRRAAERGALAPSVHNTQPWRFVVRPGAVEIRSDRTRRLSVLDPTLRQLTISCGCALLNARVAMAAAGFEPVVERFPDPMDPDLLARVSLGRGRTSVPIGELDAAIDDRRTNRRDFGDEPVPPGVVHELVAHARSEHGRLIAITEPTQYSAAAELCRRANDLQNADPAYLTELLAWTTDDPRRGDGVQAASVAYAGGLATPAENVSRDSVPIRTFDVRGNGWLPSATGSGRYGCLLLLASSDDTPDDWLRAGEALERVWLTLTAAGYAASPISAPVEIAGTREELRTLLRSPLYPQIMLRVGRAPSTVPTRRRKAIDVISAT